MHYHFQLRETFSFCEWHQRDEEEEKIVELLKMTLHFHEPMREMPPGFRQLDATQLITKTAGDATASIVYPHYLKIIYVEIVCVYKYLNINFHLSSERTPFSDNIRKLTVNDRTFKLQIKIYHQLIRQSRCIVE